MRQLPPTGRLCVPAIFSMSSRKRIAHRLIDQWSIETPLFHHLIEVPVGQRVSCISADADQDRKVHPYGVEPVDSSWIRIRNRNRSLLDRPASVP